MNLIVTQFAANELDTSDTVGNRAFLSNLLVRTASLTLRTTVDYKKRWGFDALTYQHRKYLIKCKWAKKTHNTPLFYILCCAQYGI